MKRTCLFGTIMAAALGVSVAAQSQNPPATGQTPPTQGTTGTQIQQPVPGTKPDTPPANQPVTLTGCLTPLTGATAGYTLNNVTGGATDAPTSYTLIGGDRSAMVNYGNSRVEVIGSLAAPVGTGNAVGTTGRGSTSAAAPPSSPASPAGTISTGAAGTGGGMGTGAAGTGAAGTGAAGSITTSPAGTTPPPPNFTVTSIRQVPGSCGGDK
jgi:hypothetical protein